METIDHDNEDNKAVRESLLQWKREGIEDPIMPVYRDVSGDGIPDYYGLTPLGLLEYRTDHTQGVDVAALFGTTASEGP